MFRKFFGPYPDEPLLYSFDKILGLFHKFDSKLKSKNADKQIDIDTTVTVDEKINEVIDETTTDNDVTSVTATTENEVTGGTANTENDVTEITVMKKVSMEIVETSSHTSKSSGVECTTISNSDKINQVTELPPKTENTSTTPRSMLVTTSSMECNYPLSKMNVAKKSLHTAPLPSTKVNSFTKCSTRRYARKGCGDSVTVVEDKFQKKLIRTDGKSRYESILKKETKQQKIRTSPNINLNQMERCNRTIKELTSRPPQKAVKNVKLKDRNVIKTEWAVTRIYTFDDDSQTYEIMNRDKILDKNGGIERIFAIAPNLTTVAYNTLKRKDKKR